MTHPTQTQIDKMVLHMMHTNAPNQNAYGLALALDEKYPGKMTAVEFDQLVADLTPAVDPKRDRQMRKLEQHLLAHS